MWQSAYSREDLFRVLQKSFKASENAANANDLRFMVKTLQAFERNGLGDGHQGHDSATPPHPPGAADTPHHVVACSANPDARLHLRAARILLTGGSAAEYQKLNQECTQLTAQYEQNINEDTSVVQLTKEELAGMPDSFFEGLPQTAGPGGTESFEVSMKAPARVPVMEQAKVAATRSKVKAVADNR